MIIFIFKQYEYDSYLIEDFVWDIVRENNYDYYVNQNIDLVY